MKSSGILARDMSTRINVEDTFPKFTFIYDTKNAVLRQRINVDRIGIETYK